MMAGVARNAAALLVAALVSLPGSVSGLERPADGGCTGSSALAVAGTRDATVLALVKALRFAPTRCAGGFAGLDLSCARRRRNVWATADGGSAGGSGSAGLDQQGGLPPSGRHNSHGLGNHPGGLEGQLEPVEPVSVLDPNGGCHAVF